MHTNLYEYICSPIWQQSLPANAIIISDVEILSEHTHYPLLYLTDKNNIQSIDQHHVIIILHRYTLQDILQLHLPTSHTIINLNPGVVSMQTKHHEQYDDITTMLWRHYTVHEPVSPTHFSHLIQQKDTYLRIFDIPLPWSLATADRPEEIQKIQWDHISNDLTIISNIGIVDTVASVVHQLTTNGTYHINHFVISEYTNNLSPDLVASIAESGRCVVCIDHKATEAIRMYRETLITHSCTQKPLIHYIFPQFHMVSSILPEYLHEEAQFDHQAIAWYIMDILPQTEYNNSMTFDLWE